MSQVIVDANALNALCEAAHEDMRLRSLVGAVRGSVKSAPVSARRASRAWVEPEVAAPALATDLSES